MHRCSHFLFSLIPVLLCPSLPTVLVILLLFFPSPSFLSPPIFPPLFFSCSSSPLLPFLPPCRISTEHSPKLQIRSHSYLRAVSEVSINRSLDSLDPAGLLASSPKFRSRNESYMRAMSTISQVGALLHSPSPSCHRRPNPRPPNLLLYGHAGGRNSPRASTPILKQTLNSHLATTSHVIGRPCPVSMACSPF